MSIWQSGLPEPKIPEIQTPTFVCVLTFDWPRRVICAISKNESPPVRWLWWDIFFQLLNHFALLMSCTLMTVVIFAVYGINRSLIFAWITFLDKWPCAEMIRADSQYALPD